MLNAHTTGQNVALTTTVKDQWHDFTNQNNHRQHPPLIEVCRECTIMDPPPHGFRVDRYTPYAHVNYPGWFFTTVLNDKGEILFTGLLRVRTPNENQTHNTHRPSVTLNWPAVPEGLTLQQMEDYVTSMRREAVQLCDRREITEAQCTERIAQLREVLKSTSREHYRNINYEDELRRVIAYLVGKGVDDTIIDALSNFEHRFEVENVGEDVNEDMNGNPEQIGNGVPY